MTKVGVAQGDMRRIGGNIKEKREIPWPPVAGVITSPTLIETAPRQP